MTLDLNGIPEIMMRSGIVYLVLIIVFRLIGKRHVAQLSLVDFILILLVSNAVQNAMVGNDNSLGGGLIAALTLIAINVLLTRFIVKDRAFGRFIEGEPKLIIRHGKILKRFSEENLRLDELHEAIRKAGFFSVTEVGEAVLEVDGSISVIGMGEPYPAPKQHTTLPK